MVFCSLRSAINPTLLVVGLVSLVSNLPSQDFRETFKKTPPQRQSLTPQLTFTCSKLTIETLQKGIKYV